VLKPNTDAGCEKLIQTIDKGMVINRFLGGNFNPATGQFSYGIAGLWIENGKIARPVEGMNVSGNYGELWNNLIKVGNDPYPYSRVKTPSLMFSKLSLSGNGKKETES
jgi:PmbA protein